MHATIRVLPESRDALERFKFQLSGEILRQVTQGDAIRVLVKLAESHMDESVKIAEDLLKDH